MIPVRDATCIRMQDTMYFGEGEGLTVIVSESSTHQSRQEGATLSVSGGCVAAIALEEQRFQKVSGSSAWWRAAYRGGLP